jgi:hypothetical protein
MTPDQHRPSVVNHFSMMVDDYNGRCRSFRTKSLKDISTTEHPLIKAKITSSTSACRSTRTARLTNGKLFV